jgi:hypothetical protein
LRRREILPDVPRYPRADGRLFGKGLQPALAFEWIKKETAARTAVSFCLPLKRDQSSGPSGGRGAGKSMLLDSVNICQKMSTSGRVFLIK